MTRSVLVKVLVCVTFAALWASPARAQGPVELVARLSGSNETPALINTGAFGSATASVDPVNQTATVRVEVWNLPSGTTGGHIHAGGPLTGGPIIWNLNPTTNLSNDYSFTFTITCANLTLRPDQGIRSCDDAFQAILGENTYINVHTAVNPGGEIRGQLVVRP